MFDITAYHKKAAVRYHATPVKNESFFFFLTQQQILVGI